MTRWRAWWWSMAVGSVVVGLMGANVAAEPAGAAGMIEISGKVLSIDPAKRQLTIQERALGLFPSGSTALMVSEQAEIEAFNEQRSLRLSDVEPGDTVTVQYKVEEGTPVAHAVVVKEAAHAPAAPKAGNAAP